MLTRARNLAFWRPVCWSVLALFGAATGGGMDLRNELGWHSLARWEQPQGLPQNTVFSLFQTSDGYIWIGTRGGAARFDGVSFVTFDNRDPRQVRDNEVWALAEGDDHSVWIGTYGGGVSRLKDGQFTVFTTRDGLAGDFVAALCKDREGSLWIATDTGVSRFKDGHFTNFTVKDGLNSDTVRTLCLDRDGSVMMGTMKGGVYRFKDGVLSACDLGPTPPTSEIRVIHHDAAGTFWVGSTAEGLLRIQHGQSTWFNEASGLPSNRVMCMSEDGEGQLWLGTTGGLLRYHDDHFSLQPLSDSSGTERSVMSLGTDREGSLWVGTADRGLVCLHRNLFKSYVKSDGLLDEIVWAIVQDKNGDMILGNRKGLSLLHDGRIVPYSARNGLPELSLMGLTCDRDGTIWVSTEDGLYRCQPGQVNAAGEHRFERVDDKIDAIHHISSRVVLKDHVGTIWIGTTLEGLVKLQDNACTVYTTKDGLSSNAIRGLCEDFEGNVWIGTRGGGLVRERDGKFTVYTEKDGLVSNFIQALYLDHEGTLWIGTRLGLGRLKDGKFTRYTVADGLFVNYVSGISEDRLGNLWMGCAKGVFRISFSDLTAFAEGKIPTVRSIGYGAEHGLSSTVGTVGVSPSVYTSNDGLVWFGTYNGGNVLDPALLTVNRLPPPVHIAEVMIDRTTFPSDHPIQAGPGRGDLGFRYSGVSFLAPEKMKFKYRLEGYDLDWIEAGARREAFYSNIPPGAYTFRVIAANADGIWNETGAAVPFQLRPHAYQTGWFRGLLGLLGAAAIAGAFRLRVRHLRRRSEVLQQQNAELERRIAERTAELSQSYEALRASEYFYQSLVESLPQIILRKDAEGRITYANAAFGELLGRPCDRIVGHLESEFYPAELAAKFRADDRRVMDTRQPMEFQTIVDRDGRPRCYLQVKKVALHDADNRAIGVQVLFWDMTVFRETEEKLREAHRELIEISRLAGIAEVATGVLHNLGNALNSVNTSTTLAATHVRELKIPSVGKISSLLTEQGDRLAEFMTSDPRGLKIPGYLNLLCTELQSGQRKALDEITAVRDSVEHIKEVVAAQQSHVHVSALTEVMPASEILEYALRLNEASLQRHQIVVSREFTATPLVNLSRGKALQILGNLLRNAEESLVETDRLEKQLTLGVRLSTEGRVQIYVSDNGVGIAPETRTRIFAFGYTTKKTGHGFGLHSSALAARELGGSLIVQSDGLGQGATFILELPVWQGAAADRGTTSPPPVETVGQA